MLARMMPLGLKRQLTYSKMQNQAPGYVPRKKRAIKGVRKGNDGNVRQASKKAGKNKQVRKTSAYSKNRTGFKMTTLPGYKSFALESSMKPIQQQSNNLPGFNFPGAAPLL